MKLNFFYSVKFELDRVKDTINRKEFFLKNGYKPRLPGGLIFKNFDLSDAEKLITKEFNEELALEFENEIKTKWKKYHKSILTFVSHLPYEKPKSLDIIFTQYGNSGSYHAPNTVIIGLQNINRAFSVVVHEFLHILIENSVVSKYKLSQWEKESLIDYLMCESSELNRIFPLSGYQKSPPQNDLLEKIGWDNLDFEKVKPQKQSPLVKKYNKEVRDFFGVPEIKFNVHIMKSRAECDLVAGRKTEDWFVGFANGKNVFILDKDKFETESCHSKSDFERTLKHEISHVYYYQFSGGGKPNWLDEGTAFLVAGQKEKSPKEMIDIKTLDRYHDGSDAGIYSVGWHMVSHIMDDYGKEKLFELTKIKNRKTRYSELKKMFSWLK